MIRLISIFTCLFLSISSAYACNNAIKPKASYGGNDISIMSTPTGIVIDEFDNIYVTETGANVVKKFSQAGDLLANYLEPGRELGQLNSPVEAFYLDSIVYIAELGNDRVTRITADGILIDTVGEGVLVGPRALTVEADGTMHILDEFDNTVKVFNSAGDMISSCTNDLFHMPNDIELDGGFYYLSNTNAQTIMKTDLNCQTIAEFGVYGAVGTDTDHFYYPRAIKVIDDLVYVADSSNNRVRVFDKDFNHVQDFGGLGILNGPSSIEQLSTGELAVVSSGDSLVKIFDPADLSAPTRVVGNPRVGEDLLSSPNAADYDNKANEVYVADYANSRVVVFDEKSGEVKRQIGQLGYGSNPGDLLVVGGIKLAGDYLYVTSMFTHDVVVFTKQGEQVARFGSFGTELGQFNRPYSIQVDDDANVYIGELMGGRIQKFSSDYQPLGIIGTPGVGPGKIFTPIRMDLLSDNSIIVTDYYMHKVVKVDLETNETVGEYGEYGLEEGKLFLPFGISADKKEKHILIGEAGNNRITVLTKDLEFVKTLGQIGTLEDDFFFPSDIIPMKGTKKKYLIPNRISNKVEKLKIKL